MVLWLKGFVALQAPVAQGIEQRFPKPCVGGSSPPGRTKNPRGLLPMMDDVQRMQRALDQANRAAQAGEVPVGAVLFSHDGRMLASNHNRRETDQDPCAHAEILVIRQAAQAIGQWRLTGATLAVTLEPCLMCAGAIILARIERLIYGASDPKAGAVISLYRALDDPRLNHQVMVEGGILADQSRELLQRFFHERRQR